MTALEDRTNPTGSVTVASLGNITENGSAGAFRFVGTGFDTPTEVYFSFSISSTASSLGDYTAGGVWITCSNGNNDLSITPNNDSNQEGTESIIIVISSSLNYAGGGGTATMYIYDDDTTQVSVAKQGGDPLEGSNGTFRITRSGSTSGNLTVNYTVAGSATPGTDYTSIGTSALITNGNSYVDVTVATSSDVYYEGDETVTLTVTDNGATYSAYGSSAFAAMMIDDDVAADAAVVSHVGNIIVYTGGAGADSDLTVVSGSGAVTLADSGVSGIYIDAATATGFSLGSGSATFTGSFNAVQVLGGNGNDVLDGSGFDPGLLLILDGDTGDDSIIGSDGNDSILGGEDDDTLLGGDSDDTMNGGDGADDMDGGDGNDVMHGDGGDNAMNGGDGNDFLMGDLGDGSSTLLGGNGDDTLCSDPAMDTADGEAGDNVVNPAYVSFDFDESTVFYYGGDSVANVITITAPFPSLMIDDTGPASFVIDPECVALFSVSGSTVSYGGYFEQVHVSAGDMDDAIDATAFASDAELSIWGGDGDDDITGSPGIDYLFGDDGEDEIEGMGSRDFIEGGEDADIIYGDGPAPAITDGDDEIRGDAGNDFIYGGGEGDKLYGGDGIDNINGNDGDDLIDGGVSADNLVGEYGKDTIHGDDGNDTLLGGGDDDDLFGGNNNDTILGGTGEDSLFGNDGADLLEESDKSSGSGGDGEYDTLDGGDGADTICFENGFDVNENDPFDVQIWL